MYAEERQQAMAAARRRARPGVGDRARAPVRRHHRDRPPRPVGPRAAAACVRRVHGGAVPADALTVIETGLGERDLAQHRRRRTGSPPPRSTCCPAAGATVLLDAGTTTDRLAGLLPRDLRLTVVTHAVPDRRPARRLPRTSSCTCCPAGSAATTQAAVGAETVDALGRAPRRRRLRRHQRPHRRATASPPPTATRPPTKRAIVAAARTGRRARRLQQDRRRAHRSGSPSSPTSTCWSPTTGSPPPTAGPSSAPASRWWSHDPHPDRPTRASTAPSTLGRPARARRRAPRRRRSPRRPAARASTSPAPRSRPASPSIAVLPGAPRRPVRRTSCSPPASTAARRRPTGDVRVNLTITEPDGTTTKLNSPGATVTADLARRPEAERCSPAPPTPPGWCSPARCRPARPSTGTPTWSRRCADAGARIAVDTSDAPAVAPWSPASPDAAPDLMKPNGEELASFTGGDADDLEADPAAAAAAAAPARRPGRRRRAGDARRRTAPCSSPPTAPGTPRPRRPPSSAPSVPATPACSATSSGDLRGGSPTERLALAVAYGSAPPASLRDDRSRNPTQTAPRAGHGASAHHSGGVRRHDRPDHRRPGPSRRRPRRRQARRDPRAWPASSPTPAAPPTPTSSSRTRSPARPRRRPGCPAASPSRTAAPPASTMPTLAFARLSPGSTSAPRTARPTWSS